MHHAGYVMVEWCVPAVDIPSGSRTDIFERQASMAHFLPPALFSPSHNTTAFFRGQSAVLFVRPATRLLHCSCEKLYSFIPSFSLC